MKANFHNLGQKINLGQNLAKKMKNTWNCASCQQKSGALRDVPRCMHHLTKRPQSGRHVVRGDLYKVADIPEVANFQFNTDQHPMTLDK